MFISISAIEELKSLEVRITDLLKEIKYDVEIFAITPFMYGIKEHEQAIIAFFSRYKKTQPFCKFSLYNTVSEHFERSHKRLHRRSITQEKDLGIN